MTPAQIVEALRMSRDWRPIRTPLSEHLCPETLDFLAEAGGGSHNSPHIRRGLPWASYGIAAIYGRVGSSSGIHRYVTVDGDSSAIVTDADGVPAILSITYFAAANPWGCVASANTRSIIANA